MATARRWSALLVEKKSTPDPRQAPLGANAATSGGTCGTGGEPPGCFGSDTSRVGIASSMGRASPAVKRFWAREKPDPVKGRAGLDCCYSSL